MVRTYEGSYEHQVVGGFSTSQARDFAIPESGDILEMARRMRHIYTVNCGFGPPRLEIHRAPDARGGKW